MVPGLVGDGARLGFVRLRCHNLTRTLKFYTSVLHFEHLRTVNADETGQLVYAYLAPRGGPRSTTVDLRFECERSRQVKLPKGARAEECKSSSVRLVCYARSVRDVTQAVERSDSGAWVLAPPQRHAAVSIALIVDPNGILVQVVEVGSDALLKVPPGTAVTRSADAEQMAEELESTDKLSFHYSPVRLGAVVIKSDNALEHARYYEALFAPSVMSEAESGIRRSVGGSAVQALAKRCTRALGLRIVDAEEFPDMLSTYVWVGGGPRSKFTTLCLMHKIERESGGTRRYSSRPRQLAHSTQAPHLSDAEDMRLHTASRDAAQIASESDPLLGLGIKISELEKHVVRLQRHLRHPVRFTGEPSQLAGVGRVCSFHDCCDLPVMLVDAFSALEADSPEEAAKFLARERRLAQLDALTQQEEKEAGGGAPTEGAGDEETKEGGGAGVGSNLPHGKSGSRDNSVGSPRGKVFTGRVNRLVARKVSQQ